MKTLCIIPARGGSKGLKRKNVLMLNGKPLIHWPIKAALSAKNIDEVFVSTDDEEIASKAIESGAEVPFLRPKHLAKSLTTTEETLQAALLQYEEYKGFKYDICVFLTSTAVFRSVDWIEEAVNALESDKSIESSFLVTKTTKNFWYENEESMFRRVFDWMKVYSSRQIRKAIFIEDTGHACATRAELWREGRRIGDNVHLIMNDNTETFIDIHSDYDLLLAEKTIEYFKNNDPSRVELFLDGDSHD